MYKKFIITGVLLTSILGQHVYASKDNIGIEKSIRNLDLERKKILERRGKSLVSVVMRAENDVEVVNNTDDSFLQIYDNYNNSTTKAKKESIISTYGYLVEYGKEIFIVINDSDVNAPKTLTAKFGNTDRECTLVGYDDYTELSIYRISDNKFLNNNTDFIPLSLTGTFVNGTYVYVFGTNKKCKKTVKIKRDREKYENNYISCVNCGVVNTIGDFIGFKTDKNVFLKNKTKLFHFISLDDNECITGIIPVEEIENVFKCLVKDRLEYVKHTLYDFTLVTLTDSFAKTNNLNVKEGCYVDNYLKDKSLDIKKGDVIVAINGYDVKDYSAFVGLFEALRNGDLTFKLINKKGDKKIVNINAGEYSYIKFNSNTKDKSLTTNGVTFTEQEIKENDVNKIVVKITSVNDGLLKTKFKDAKGLIINKINDNEIRTITDVKDAILAICRKCSKKDDKEITFSVLGYFENNDKSEVYSEVLKKEEGRIFYKS